MTPNELDELKERILQLEIQSWVQVAACERHAMVIQGLVEEAARLRDHAGRLREALADISAYADSFLNSHLDDWQLAEIRKLATQGLKAAEEEHA